MTIGPSPRRRLRSMFLSGLRWEVAARNLLAERPSLDVLQQSALRNRVRVMWKHWKTEMLRELPQ